MKKTLIIIAVVCILGLSVFSGCATNTQYLRIHIRANSNSVADQDVKYEVKAAVVDYLTPFLAEVSTKAQAKSVISSHLEDIISVADAVLSAYGFLYSANARVCAESFPTRSYGGLCLESGIYDALIIELGSGTGDNWWCVIYPPLCFVPTEISGDNIYYKSKILEIIDSFSNG